MEGEKRCAQFGKEMLSWLQLKATAKNLCEAVGRLVGICAYKCVSASRVMKKYVCLKHFLPVYLLVNIVYQHVNKCN